MMYALRKRHNDEQGHDKCSSIKDKECLQADSMVLSHDQVACIVSLLAAVPVATRCTQPSQHGPAGPSCIGPHKAKQIQHHGHPQWKHGDPKVFLLLCDCKAQDEDDDYNGQNECSRIAVEENKVPGVVGIPDNGVTGEVPGLGILPDTPGRIETCGICHCGCHNSQQLNPAAYVTMATIMAISKRSKASMARNG
uniref:Uncharacterized protein n=1 Tax=Oryza glumipatula TaxID=40148 RepID=A0A0E0A8F1_9ORYZ